MTTQERLSLCPIENRMMVHCAECHKPGEYEQCPHWVIRHLYREIKQIRCFEPVGGSDVINGRLVFRVKKTFFKETPQRKIEPLQKMYLQAGFTFTLRNGYPILSVEIQMPKRQSVSGMYGMKSEKPPAKKGGDTVVSVDDILNITKELDQCASIDEFLARIGGRAV